MINTQVAIIGGGLAGLICAINCQQLGIDYLIIEKESTVGGKQQTSLINNYNCDHGFQVLLSAYPIAQKYLNYNKLNLVPFKKNALCWDGKKFIGFANPLTALFSIINPFTSAPFKLTDYVTLATIAATIKFKTKENIFSLPNQQTQEYFNKTNLSTTFKTLFLEPFFKGIFLDPKLETSVRLFYFYLQCFINGITAIPKQGIQAIPQQLASHIPSKKILYDNKVVSIKNSIVETDNQRRIKADYICCAADLYQASKLFNFPTPKSHSVYNLYVEAPEPVIKNNIIYLDGLSNGPINNFHNANIKNKTTQLLSFSALPTSPNEPLYEKEILLHAKTYFGQQITKWNIVKFFQIKHALPQQKTSFNMLNTHYNHQNIFFCGDWTLQGSIQGAMQSGELIAKKIYDQLCTNS